MEILKADCQIFDDCFKIHWERLFLTGFRRLLRRIRVSFLPLEKTPGGFRFQLEFRIRFPKPPWTFFYIQTLLVLPLSCLNQVSKMRNNLWCRLKNLFPGVNFVSIVSREPVGHFWDFPLIGQTFIATMVMDVSELPADLFMSVQEIRRCRKMSKSRSAVRSSVNGFADDESSKEISVCGLINFSDDDTVSTASSPKLSPLRDWNAVRFHHSLTHGDPNSNHRRHMCLFNLYFLVFIIVIISSLVMATTVLDLFVTGIICWYQQRNFLWPISPFVQRDWMMIQTQMSGQQIWVIRQRRLRESFLESSTWDGLVEEIYRDEVFQNDLGTEVLVPLYLNFRISFEHIGFHATFWEKKFSHKLLHTNRNKEKSNMKLDNNGSSGRLASKATLRKASSNSLLLYFLLVYGAYSCVCNNCVSIILYVFVITLLD